LSRQYGKSKHFKTLKVMWQIKTFNNSETEWKCLTIVHKLYLGSWTPVSNLRLCPMQSSVPTRSPTQLTRAKFEPWIMIQATNKIQELRRSKKKPQSSNLAPNSMSHSLLTIKPRSN
jgi:hypothetical protein